MIPYFKTSIFILLFFSSFTTVQQRVHLVDMAIYGEEFDYEIRYATPDNFIGETLYECPKCLLQPQVAEAIFKANQYFCEKGFKIKFYDCYRPLDIQKFMWSKVPRPTYVANPYGKGSIHNKGAAVDLTLVTLEGCYVAMGSDYDFFGRASHIDNFTHSKEILAHRKLLQEGLLAVGFKTVRTEWWHFSFEKSWRFKTMNEVWECD